MAKARFSELFRKVRDQGPQRVVKHGGESVVIVAAEDSDRATQQAAQPPSLVEFFRQAPRGSTTRNVRDIRPTGVAVFNPWDD